MTQIALFLSRCMARMTNSLKLSNLLMFPVWAHPFVMTSATFFFLATFRPQVTIATAMVFCHRFYLRQSHAKNDRRVSVMKWQSFCSSAWYPFICWVLDDESKLYLSTWYLLTSKSVSTFSFALFKILSSSGILPLFFLYLMPVQNWTNHPQI
jgi:hypothetical protein